MIRRPHNTTRARLAALHARGVPEWLIRDFNREIVRVVGEQPVPLVWLVNPQRKDGATVLVRHHLIRWLLETIVQRQISQRSFLFARRADLDSVELAGPHWRTISRPHIAALLGMDQSSITLAMQKMAAGTARPTNDGAVGTAHPTNDGAVGTAHPTNEGAAGTARPT